MGSALSPVIVHIFLNSCETKYLSECHAEYRPFCYRRYLDDTFILNNHFNQATDFNHYFNSRHTEINFAFESESENKLSFVDLTIEKANNESANSIYRKKRLTSSGFNYFSYVLMSYKIGSITFLIIRAFTLTSTYALLHKEV